MGLETKTKTIDDFEFEVTQVKAKEGRRVFVRLAKIAGPGLGVLADDDIGKALDEVLKKIDDQTFDYLCDLFGKYSHVTVDGVKKQLTPGFQDTFFAAKYGLLFKWIAFCLEVNFRDFYEMLKNLDMSDLTGLKKAL